MNELTTLTPELDKLNAGYSNVGISFDDAMSKHEWASIGLKLAIANQRLLWYLADWANFGEVKFSALREYCEAHGMDYRRLRSLAKVGAGVRMDRRKDQLDFYFHAEVAGLEPKEQSKWLTDAQEQHMTRADLREAIRKDLAEEDGAQRDNPRFVYGLKYAEDLKAWLKRQPADFWTPERIDAWHKLIQEIEAVIPQP